MAKITLNIGSNANDGTGQTLRSAMQDINTMFSELYDSPLFADGISITDNEISANRSNDDLIFSPSGTGSVAVNRLVVDDNISVTDNEIKTTQSNSDLVLSASGTGAVVIDNANIDGGNIDNTTIGASVPAVGTFTQVIANTSAVIDGITITDNTITTNGSNADLELTANGSGSIKINGLLFPTADGTAGQFLKTDGSGNLGFATASASLNHSTINDSSITVASSATTVIDTFDSSATRSAKYYISISDSTNGRYEIVEANLIHGPSADSSIEAYVTSFGSTTSHTEPLATFSADVLNEQVRLKATNISNDSAVFKFQRVTIDI